MLGELVRARRLPCVLVLFAVVATACGGGGGEDALRIGLKRVALDLAFKADDEDEGRKPPPRQALQPLPVPSQSEFAVAVSPEALERPSSGPLPGSFPGVPTPACPIADAGMVPEEPASVTVAQPPKPGVYGIHRTGTFDVTGGQFPIKGPMPAQGQREISNVEVGEFVETANQLTLDRPTTPELTFDIFEQIGESSTLRTLRIRPSNDPFAGGIDLVKLVTKTRDGESTFAPSSPVRLMNLGQGEGQSWTGQGIDLNTGTAMVTEGFIEKRENVDLCGEVFNTYVVRSTERITNLQQSVTSMTDDAAENTPGCSTESTVPSCSSTGEGEGLPNTYWVATHKGGLFIQEEVHTTTQVGTLIIRLDYTNTFDAIEPR